MTYWKYSIEGKDPTNSGDAKSWFDFYKIDNGETSVIITKHSSKPEPGDHIWFFINSVSVGRAIISKVDYHPLSDGWEVYYDSNKLVDDRAIPITAAHVIPWRAS